VMAFVEKPAPGKAPSNWINAGTYIVEPAFLERVPPRLNVSVERETFPRMLDHPGLLFGYQSDAYWLDIGTPQKYLQAHDDVLAGKVGRPPAPGANEVAPGIWVQGDGHIADGADVQAPVLIGAGARVEAGATVRRSVLGARAVVETGAVLDGAVLHDGVRVSHGGHVHNAVVGADAVLKPEVALSGETIVGAGVTVMGGTSISGGRIPAERE